MQEIFYEESATIVNEKSATFKYNAFRFLSIISYFFIFIWLLIVFVAYPLDNFSFIDVIIILLPIVMFVFSGVFFGKVKQKSYVEYDYTFVTGSIRIAKIFKNIKRKFLLKFEARDVEKLGKYDSATYKTYENMPGINKIILTSNLSPADNKDFYYIAVNTDGEKKLLIFECTETFISNVLKFSNKTVIDDDFRKDLLNTKR